MENRKLIICATHIAISVKCCNGAYFTIEMIIVETEGWDDLKVCMPAIGPDLHQNKWYTNLDKIFLVPLYKAF